MMQVNTLWPGGESTTAAHIRNFDWGATPLGPPSAWPPALKTTYDIMMSSGFGMCATWGRERTLFYNEAYAPFLGRRHPAALGQPIHEVWHDIWHDIRPLIERAMAGEAVHETDLHLVMTRNGFEEDTYWTFSYSPLRNGDEVVGFLTVALETTGRVQGEVALRESEERYRSLFEQIDEGFCIIEMIFDGEVAVDYRFLDVNPVFEGHTGIHEAKGRLMREIAPEHEQFWFDRYGQVALTGKPHRFEAQGMALGGRWFEANAFRIGAPEQRRVAIVFSDITGRKHAEAELRESEERNRLMVELVPAMLWSTDPEGRIITDQGWQQRTGQQADEVKAFGWLDAIHPEDREATRKAFAHAFATGEPLERQHRIRQRGGNYRWHLVRHVPVRDARSAIARWFGAAIDVQEMHELQARQEILVNELQHRARNLLGVITAVADRTVKRGGSVEAFEERLRALSRAQGLLSQGGSDKVEVGALVRAELAAHADAAEDRLTILGPKVHLAARQMQNFALALHALTTNAVKYGALKGDNGQLAISWDVVRDARERRRLALNWVESGVAIKPEQITRRGYGTELIQEALAYALDATVDYVLGPDGVRCRIEMPLA